MELPYDFNAEQQTLGCIILSTKAATKLFSSGILQAKDFYLEMHQDIFTTLSEMYQANQAIDEKTLEHQLAVEGILPHIQEENYIRVLQASPISSTSVLSYARIVKEYSQRRRIITFADDISTKAMAEEGNLDQLLDELSNETFEILATKKSKTFYSKQEAFDQTFEEILENKKEGKGNGLSSGIESLNFYINGLQKNRMYVVAARPGVGKSILGVEFILRAAAQSQYPALFFSLEMARDQVVGRMLARSTGIAVDKILSGDVNEEQLTKLKEAAKTIDENIYIEDNSNLTTGDIYSIARNTCLEHGQISLIVVDYIQYIKSTGIESRQQQISNFSRDLSHMAKQLEVPVVVLSQLNRSIDGRLDKRPQLSDLRDSGAIEQDAHSVLMMYYPDEEIKEEVTLIVAKNRSGACGEVNLRRNGSLFSFKEAGVLSKPSDVF